MTENGIKQAQRNYDNREHPDYYEKEIIVEDEDIIEVEDFYKWEV